MVSNEQAAKDLRAAMMALLGPRNAATGAEKTRIGRTQQMLLAEYLHLHGLEPAADYKVLTAAFKGATGQIEGLIKRRQQFTQDANTAAQVFSTLTSVLRLIS